MYYRTNRIAAQLAMILLALIWAPIILLAILAIPFIVLVYWIDPAGLYRVLDHDRLYHFKRRVYRRKIKKDHD